MIKRMLEYNVELVKSLNIESPTTLSVGFYYLGKDKYLRRWSPWGSGSYIYKGSLPIEEVCKVLNEETKKLCSTLPRLSSESNTEILEAQGISRFEANSIISNSLVLPSCIEIEGGPLNGYIQVNNCLIPKGTVDTWGLTVEDTLIFTPDDRWEVVMSYQPTLSVEIIKRSNNKRYYLSYFDEGDIELREFIKPDLIVVTKEDSITNCVHLKRLLRRTYTEGKKAMATRMSEMCRQILDK